MNDLILIEPAWRERMLGANGIEFHIVEAGEPGAPLLLLLHGFPEFWWAWRKQLTPLAVAGFHVVAPDLRGFNLSSAPQGMPAYQLDIVAADIVALSDALGADRIHLVGHDWGAVIGWWVAARYPDKLKQVVLISGPHPQAWARQALSNPGQALRSAYIAFFQLPWLPETALGARGFARLKSAMRRSTRERSLDPHTLDQYARAWERPDSLSAMLNYYRALRRLRAEPPLASIRPPVLVLWGDKDRFLGRGVMEASAALCENGQFVAIEGASHWLHWEDPERITAEILGFLRVA
jgi:pimeloyl-ACP methyl ester carboxylesterase